jgi:hypothetical protein
MLHFLIRRKDFTLSYCFRTLQPHCYPNSILEIASSYARLSCFCSNVFQTFVDVWLYQCFPRWETCGHACFLRSETFRYISVLPVRKRVVKRFKRLVISVFFPFSETCVHACFLRSKTFGHIKVVFRLETLGYINVFSYSEIFGHMKRMNKSMHEFPGNDDSVRRKDIF